MKKKNSCLVCALFWIACSLVIVEESRGAETGAGENACPRQVTVRAVTYDGWPNSLAMANGQVEAVVVPAVGRVMQFRFRGEEGPFWENGALHGRAPDPESKEWINFGGDKTWPAPQDDWEKIMRRSWPPPAGFDAMPVEAVISSAQPCVAEITLTSVVDPSYGIEISRKIHLDLAQPLLTIETTYRKVSGSPVKAGVWVITQLKEPEAVIVLVPENSQFPDGYTKLMPQVPLDLKRAQELLSLTRHNTAATKIGSDGKVLIWIGREHAVRIDTSRIPGAEYPDQGSSVEVYTNPDPLAYVELETLGPLKTMRIGDTLTLETTYRLSRRTEKDSLAEARALLKGWRQ